MIRWFFGMLAGLVMGATAWAAFSPRTAAERAAALGSLDEVAPELRGFLAPDDDFELIPLPEPGDWLSQHVEPGQTFAEFRASRPLRPDGTRRVIYLQPIGDFSPKDSPSLDILRAYATAFFQLEVMVLPAYRADDLEFSPRVNPQTSQVQVLTTSVLDFLEKRLPPDAFCLLAITLRDLYPQASWNYVFGQASLTRRVGVYSFARHDPDFFGEERPAGYRRMMLMRGCKVLAHETGHMFGLAHCIYYDCAMNGSNHLAESDARTVHLCPVCLRKLQDSTGFDAAQRYRALETFHRAQGWTENAAWCARQLEKRASR